MHFYKFLSLFSLFSFFLSLPVFSFCLVQRLILESFSSPTRTDQIQYSFKTKRLCVIFSVFPTLNILISIETLKIFQTQFNKHSLSSVIFVFFKGNADYFSPVFKSFKDCYFRDLLRLLHYSYINSLKPIGLFCLLPGLIQAFNSHHTTFCVFRGFTK